MGEICRWVCRTLSMSAGKRGTVRSARAPTCRAARRPLSSMDMDETPGSGLEGPTPPRVAAALAQGEAWVSLKWTPATIPQGPFRRHVAVGDPQAGFEKYLRILDRHGLLGEDGKLRPD